jgi:hypothetical protein
VKNGVVVAVLVVLVVGSLGLGYFAGSSSHQAVTTTTSTVYLTTTTTPTQNVYANVAECDTTSSCSAQNPQGLALTLSLNTTTVPSNGTFTIRVSEFNPTTRGFNLTLSNGWALDTLPSFYVCYSGDPPYGASIYRGYYTLQNISSVHPVQVYSGPQPSCHPSLDGPVVTFVASPNSGIGGVYQNLNNSVILEPFTAVVYAIDGTTVMMSNPSVNNGEPEPTTVYSLRSSQPAVYTVVGGDEWGDLVLLHFIVT